MRFCCKEFEDFYNEINSTNYQIGDGEISGDVSLDKYSTDNHLALSISNGWNSAYIDFKYCPNCGKKIEYED